MIIAISRIKFHDLDHTDAERPMKTLLMPDLHQKHHLQIQIMVHNREINIIDGLKIEQIDLVNYRYSHKEESAMVQMMTT